MDLVLMALMDSTLMYFPRNHAINQAPPVEQRIMGKIDVENDVISERAIFGNNFATKSLNSIFY